MQPSCCCVGLTGRESKKKKWKPSTMEIELTLVINSKTITHKSCMTRCSSRAPLIVAEAINAMHLISIEQQNEEGNTLRNDPSNNLGNFNR